MIVLKLAFKSVFRRPKQNLAVVLGIALGVSLFVGVQVGGDSLGEGLRLATIHSLGETDASIESTISPFFITASILNEELIDTPPGDSILSQLKEGGEHLDYIKSMVERLTLSVSVIEQQTGSIEISQSLKGIDPTEQHFGEFTNIKGDNLNLNSLSGNEIFLGKEISDALFVDKDPIGQSLTIQTTLYSFGSSEFNITSQAIPLTIDATVKDIFVDEGKGRENFANFMTMPLDRLQEIVFNTFENAKTTIDPTIIGYGSKPITSILVNYNDDVESGSESEKATSLLKSKFNSIVGMYSRLYQVQDTRADIIDQVTDAVDSLELILNVFGAIIILAGVLVIVNIQNMALAAREKETGILRALGSSKGQIIRTNLLESMFLGIIGSLFGLIGGAIYGKLLVIFLGISFQFPTSDIPTVITQSTLVSSFIAGFVISQVTGILPAIQASRINIAQVLRGLDKPPTEQFGRKSLYAGVLITIFALLNVINLDPNPIVNGTDAFRDLGDIEAMYLPIASLIIGPALLFAYYRSKKIGLTIASLFVLGWAYFNIFFVFDWLETGTGGLNYILFLIASLVAGTIILVGMNLSFVAALGQKLASWFARNKKTPIRGTTMVAFRKMRSNITRSTLTFALFATILTLNIFIGTWSYSFRYGYDSLVEEFSGDADIILYSADNSVPESLDISSELIAEFGATSRDVRLTNLVPFTMTQGNEIILDPDDPDGSRTARMISTTENALWEDSSRDNWLFKFNLLDNKTGELEYYQNQDDDPPATEEDENVWKELLSNGTITTESGEEKPIIVTSYIAEFENNQFVETHKPGDSVYLNLTNGELQEFVIAATVPTNPLVDFTMEVQEGPPSFPVALFVSDYWKDRLLGFQGYTNQENTYLGQTNVDEINSEEIPELLTEIETYVNNEDGEFRQNYGLFGIIGVSVYSIYEAQLEGQYRFFGFLQAFTSLGFAVGILGLLVVASRSVAERTREIGMLRALGFRRRDVVISVVLELFVMGLIGLVLGFLNGVIMGYALTDINSAGEAQFLIPWLLIGAYAAVTFISAIVAAIFPALRASKIPASDALRYTG